MKTERDLLPNTNDIPINGTDESIMSHYRDLWHILFRMTKLDLKARPIYHYKREPIEAHVLTCFMSLSICKYMELKTGKSTKQIVKLFKSVTDAVIINEVTEEKVIIPHLKTEEVKGFIFIHFVIVALIGQVRENFIYPWNL